MLKGKLGWKGERGFSTYELAVQHGFDGTEEEWLETLGIEQVYDYVDEHSKPNSDFAVLTGTHPGTSISSTVAYPTGFTKDNCVVISYSNKYSGNTKYTTPAATPEYNLEFLQMDTNNIQIWSSYAFTHQTSFDYIIVLMKIS